MQEALINKAFDLHDWITQNLDDLDIPRERNILLSVSCHDIVIEHHIGIVVLLRSDINGSAFALVRPLFETFVRGVWLRRCATEDQINDYINDRLGLRFSQLLETIERLDGFTDGMLSSLKENAWRAMNSYTHGGIQQAGRRVSGAYIKPDFSHEEIIEVIKLASTFALLAFQQITFEANRNDLAIQANGMLTRVGDA